MLKPDLSKSRSTSTVTPRADNSSTSARAAVTLMPLVDMTATPWRSASLCRSSSG